MTIKAFVTDVDGCLTDGGIIFDEKGRGTSRFHAHDGLGLSVLRKMNVKLIAISGRNCVSVKHRLEQLGFDHMMLGSKEKLIDLESYLEEANITPNEIAFMGDDLIDYEIFKKVNVTYAPSNAVENIKEVAKHQTIKAGGEGAVREAVEHLLKHYFSTSILVEYFKNGSKAVIQ